LNDFDNNTEEDCNLISSDELQSKFHGYYFDGRELGKEEAYKY